MRRQDDVAEPVGRVLTLRGFGSKRLVYLSGVDHDVLHPTLEPGELHFRLPSHQAGTLALGSDAGSRYRNAFCASASSVGKSGMSASHS